MSGHDNGDEGESDLILASRVRWSDFLFLLQYIVSRGCSFFQNFTTSAPWAIY